MRRSDKLIRYPLALRPVDIQSHGGDSLERRNLIQG